MLLLTSYVGKRYHNLYFNKNKNTLHLEAGEVAVEKNNLEI